MSLEFALQKFPKEAKLKDNLKARLRPLARAEDVALALAAGRILAEDVRAPLAIPAHTNAAVDGYVFASRDYDAKTGTAMPVRGRSAAGHPLAHAPAPGSPRIASRGRAMHPRPGRCRSRPGGYPSTAGCSTADHPRDLPSSPGKYRAPFA